jgi:hypothetical protein
MQETQLPANKLDFAKKLLEKTINVPKDEYYGYLKIASVDLALLVDEVFQLSNSNLTLATATLENLQKETNVSNTKMARVVKRVAIMPSTILFSSVFRNVPDRCHICGETESLCELLTVIYCPERFVFGPMSTNVADPKNKNCINYEVEDVRYCKHCKPIYEIDSSFYGIASNIIAFANWINYIVLIMAQTDHRILTTIDETLLSGWRNDRRIYKYQKAMLTPRGLVWSQINIAFSYVIVNASHRGLRKILVFHTEEEALKYIEKPIYIDTDKFTEQVKKVKTIVLVSPKEDWKGFLAKAHFESYYFMLIPEGQLKK